MLIHCCGCDKKINARLTDGQEVYPHRKDLFKYPYWKCDTCNNYVGCHHKTKERTRPLGPIPTPELRKLRYRLHAMLDPIWKTKLLSRKRVYELMSKSLGKPYHSAEITSVDQANEAIKAARQLLAMT